RLGRRAREFPAAETDTAPRSQETRDGSEGRGLAGVVVPKRLRPQVIEAARLSITLDLTVPERPVVFQEPCAKLRQLFRRERLDVLLDLFDLAHRPFPDDVSVASSVPVSSRRLTICRQSWTREQSSTPR